MEESYSKNKIKVILYNQIFTFSTDEQLKINENEEKNAINYKINNGFIIPFFNKLNRQIPKTLETEKNLKTFLAQWNNKDLLIQLSVLCSLLDKIIEDFNTTHSNESKVLMSDIADSECLMGYLSFDNQKCTVEKFPSFFHMINYFFNEQQSYQECPDSSDDEIIQEEFKQTGKKRSRDSVKDQFLKKMFISFFKIMNTHQDIFVSYLYSNINLQPQNYHEKLINPILQFLYDDSMNIEQIKQYIDSSLIKSSEEITKINRKIKNFLHNKPKKKLYLFISQFNHKYIVYKENQNGKEIIIKEFFRDNENCENISQFIYKYCGLNTFDIYNFKQRFRQASWKDMIAFMEDRKPCIKNQEDLKKIIEYQKIIKDFREDCTDNQITNLAKKQKKKEIINFLLNLYVVDGAHKTYGLNCGFNNNLYPIICKEFNQLNKDKNPKILEILTKKSSVDSEVAHHANGLINYNILPTHIIKSLITYI